MKIESLYPNEKITSIGSGISFTAILYWLAGVLGKLTAFMPTNDYQLIAILIVIMAIMLCGGGAFTFFGWAVGYPKSAFKKI